MKNTEVRNLGPLLSFERATIKGKNLDAVVLDTLQ